MKEYFLQCLSLHTFRKVVRDNQRDLNKKVGLKTLNDIETESVDGTYI